MMEELKKMHIPKRVVVPVRMTPAEREELDKFYRQSTHKSRSDYILAVLKESWQG